MQYHKVVLVVITFFIAHCNMASAITAFTFTIDDSWCPDSALLESDQGPKVETIPVELAIKNIAKLEGFRATPYDDVGGHAIGYGQQISKDQLDLCVTKEEAYAMLRQHVLELHAFLLAKVTVALTNTQVAVLLSFIYNVGRSNFAKSTLYRTLNDGNYSKVPTELKRWVYVTVYTSSGTKVKKRLKGLVNRRNIEANLWAV